MLETLIAIAIDVSSVVDVSSNAGNVVDDAGNVDMTLLQTL
jgi:hypothetical protein